MTRNVPLRLHFDVNKTIDFEDRVKGETPEQAVTRMLCDATWGSVTSSGEWLWDGRPPSATPSAGVAPRVSYTEYLQKHRRLNRRTVIEAQTLFLTPGHPSARGAIVTRSSSRSSTA